MLRPANSIWIGFVSLQAGDGVLTLLGMYTYGLHIEGNPLIAWYAALVGPVVAVSCAKLFAVGCGAFLHLARYHRTIAALAVFYALFAIGPWMHVLSQ